MELEELVEKLKEIDPFVGNVLKAVKYDDELGGFYLKYDGGDKIAVIGDKVPIAAMNLAVANEGKWIVVGVGN